MEQGEKTWVPSCSSINDLEHTASIFRKLLTERQIENCNTAKIDIIMKKAYRSDQKRIVKPATHLYLSLYSTLSSLP